MNEREWVELIDVPQYSVEEEEDDDGEGRIDSHDVVHSSLN